MAARVSLEGFSLLATMEMPTWAHLTIPEIDYQAISYYADPNEKERWSEEFG